MTDRDHCEPYHGRADTSRAAHRRTSDNQRETVRKQIVDIIARWEDAIGNRGMTCDQVEQVLRLSHQTASARIAELRHDNRIHDTGRRRPTRSGRKARVYKAGPKPDADGQGKLL